MWLGRAFAEHWSSTKRGSPSCSRPYAVELHQSTVTHAQVAAIAKMAKTVLALALGSAAAFSPNAAPRATTIVKSDPNIKTDVGSGWKPESGGFSSTDTPDFFYDDDDERVTKQRPSINDTSHSSITGRHQQQDRLHRRHHGEYGLGQAQRTKYRREQPGRGRRIGRRPRRDRCARGVVTCCGAFTSLS